MPNDQSLLAYLNEKKLNVTQQRLQIANLFLALPGHHTLEEIYLAVREKTSNIGQTTVYRTIKLLCDAGLAREIRLEDNSSRYESNVDRGHHDHMLCQQCGKLVEFVNDDIERLQEQIAEQYGFTLEGHHLLLFGTCGECRAKKSSAS